MRRAVSARVRPDLFFSVTDERQPLASGALEHLRVYLARCWPSASRPACRSPSSRPDRRAAPSLRRPTPAWSARPWPRRPRPRYDLASLTKVVAPSPWCCWPARAGALALEDPVARWLPRYPEPRTTLWHLLTHTSGLVDHRPVLFDGAGRDPIEAAVYAEAATRPGRRGALLRPQLHAARLGARGLPGAAASTRRSLPRWRRPSGWRDTGFRPTDRAAARTRPPSSTATSASCPASSGARCTTATPTPSAAWPATPACSPRWATSPVSSGPAPAPERRARCCRPVGRPDEHPPGRDRC